MTDHHHDAHDGDAGDSGWRPDLAGVRATLERIRPHVGATPVVRTWSGVALKAESLHPAGSFKIRGAFDTLLDLDADANGVVAHSSGNHAIAVAAATRRLGMRAVIVMPHDAPAAKLDRTRALGAEVHLVGSASDERVRLAGELAAQQGLVLVEPYDSRHVVSATGTISVELLDDAPSIREIHVALSGGGLAAGVAAAAHLLAAERGHAVRVIGIEPEVAATALASRRARRPIRLPAEQMARTIADGLRVQQLGSITWPVVEQYVDDIVTVTEDEIRDAMRLAARECRLVVEPSGAVPIAAAVAGHGSTVAPEQRAAIVGGGNVDPALLASVLHP